MSTLQKSMAAGIILGLAVSSFNASSTAANAEDLSAPEVEALLQERIQGLSTVQTHQLALHLIQVCEQYQFPVSAILSVIQTESQFRTFAMSQVGALGLMQVMPDTAGFVAKKIGLKGYHGAEDLFDPRTNITIGVAYLARLRDRFVQSHRYLAAYNLGPAKFARYARQGKGHPNSVSNYIKKVNDGVTLLRIHAQELNQSLNQAPLIASAGR